jgi:hypothetical protein
MIEAHNPVAVGYQIGGCLGLILAGFLADTWLWFAVVALSSAGAPRPCESPPAGPAGLLAPK